MAHGQSLIYPNLPGRASFSTNHVEPGTHTHPQLGLAGQRARHRVALVNRSLCAQWGMRCRLEDAVSSALKASDGAGKANSGAPPFELPKADDTPLWDFYCRDGGAHDGVHRRLRDAGERLRASLPTPASLDGAAWQEDGSTFEEYSTSPRPLQDEL